MLERLFLLVVAIGPIAAMLVGITVVGVGAAWVVNKVVGPRR